MSCILIWRHHVVTWGRLAAIDGRFALLWLVMHSRGRWLQRLRLRMSQGDTFRTRPSYRVESAVSENMREGSWRPARHDVRGYYQRAHTDFAIYMKYNIRRHQVRIHRFSVVNTAVRPLFLLLA